MDDKLSEILDRLPPKPPRSRLDPHAALIEELRRRGRTYREIARVLAEDCRVQSSPSNIYYFVRLRAREAKQAKALQAKQNQAGPFGSSKVASVQTTVRNTASQGNLPHDVAQRIAAFKQRKIPPPTPAGFHFDPDEPLQLITQEKPVSNK
jgi:IS30 family transposase